jgi:hypothetical protein
MHVHESMQLMIHGVELLDIGSTGRYVAQNKGNNVVLGSSLFLTTFWCNLWLPQLVNVFLTKSSTKIAKRALQ